MDCNERREILKNVEIGRGRGCKGANVANVLDALWKVADESVVGREVFEPYLLRLRPYIEQLERSECVRLTYRGRKTVRITLLKRDMPQKNSGQKKKSDAQQHVARLIKKQKAEQREEERVRVAEKEMAPPPSPQCLMFVDVPNMTHYFEHKYTTGRKARYLDAFRADWRELRQIVLEMTQIPLAQQEAYAYVRLPGNNSQQFAPVCANFKDAGFRLVERGEKDIDVLMISDLWSKALPYLQKGRTVKVVVATGDGDYAHALTDLRSYGRACGVNLSVHVLTWRHRASAQIARVANNVFFIESRLGRIDPTGANMLAYHRQERHKKQSGAVAAAAM